MDYYYILSMLTPGRLEEEIFTGQKLNHKLLQETGPGL